MILVCTKQSEIGEKQERRVEGRGFTHQDEQEVFFLLNFFMHLETGIKLVAFNCDFEIVC